jgi:hypothetical protein
MKTLLFIVVLVLLTGTASALQSRQHQESVWDLREPLQPLLRDESVCEGQSVATDLREVISVIPYQTTLGRGAHR